MTEKIYDAAVEILTGIKALVPDLKAKDLFLELCVKRTVRYICDFCNFDSSHPFPPRLIPLAGEIAAGGFLEGKLASGGLDIDGLDLSAAVKSITEGDTTVQFADSRQGTSPAELLCGYIDGLTNRDKELIAFRRFKW